MRESDVNKKKFHRGHYEIIAARFRQGLEPYMNTHQFDGDTIVTEDFLRGGKTALIDLALSLGLRFQADSEDFDPYIWLDRCSPDPERWPLSELWNDFSGLSGDKTGG